MALEAERAAAWPGLDRLGRDLAQPVITGRRARNQACWADCDNWVFGFYFGHSDTRLWVPRRGRGGVPMEEKRIVNFAHPLGRRAFRVLLLAYFIGAVFAAMLLLAVLGVRW